ncbi:MAG: trehalose-phosphatase [Humibacillus sp.]|nr:trehalose-phosphatase [Humibacillus sp.]MDN5779783.1 trehalose-phosphatase [Humibacillus sp.]
MRRHLAGALIAVDFDGTLAPIVADPGDSRLVPGAIEVLSTLSRAGAHVVIITGRDAATVVRLGGLDAVPGLRVAGLYGLETWHDGNLVRPDEPESIRSLRAQLPAVVAEHGMPGVRVEDKGLSLVVHTRRSPDPQGALAALRPPVARLARGLGLEAKDGRNVIELRLAGSDKGGVLRGVMRELDPVAMLYAGDDLGDLPAFAVVAQARAAGRDAWRVGVVSAEVPELADHIDVAVNGPAELVRLLQQVAEGAP